MLCSRLFFAAERIVAGIAQRIEAVFAFWVTYAAGQLWCLADENAGYIP